MTFCGRDTLELAEKYDTPLYLLDEDRVRGNLRIYKKAMEKYFGAGSYPLYASKALSFKRIYQIAKEEGVGIDLVSPGEIYTAAKAGFPMEKGYFHGNNKTRSDIVLAMESGVGTFVADHMSELDDIDALAEEFGKRQRVMLRITPGIDPHTHKAVVTGNVDSKFGSAIKTGQADEIVAYALTKQNIALVGFHCHIGSQIFEAEPFCDAADIMLDFIAEMKQKHGYAAAELNLGGGFGVRYTEKDPVISYEENIRLLSEHIKSKCAEYGLAMPKILMEPGRSIVADSGMTLYTIGSVKEIRGFKNYVSVDGGMPDNPRYALYQSAYTALVANRAAEKADYICTIAGRCCESGDLIGENVPLQSPKKGDILAVLTTGAYNYSMASNYNRIPRPPIVMIRNRVDYVAVKRETLEDLILNDL